MQLTTRVVESPNGSIAVADVDRRLLIDKAMATGLRRRLSATLGGMPALLRCRHSDTFIFNGEAHLYRYGVDPVVDALPQVRIDI